MDKSIKMTMLPLAICSTISGFYTLEVMTPKLRYIVIAYCCLLTALFITHFVLFAVIMLPSTQYSFGGVMQGLAQLVRLAMLTYYCVEFIVQAGDTSNILEYIDCADDCLEAVGIEAPHARERVQSTSFTVIVIFVSIVRSVFLILAWKRLLVKKTFNKIISTYYVAVDVIITHSTGMTLGHFVFLLYIIKQRISRFRSAVEKIEVIFARQIAWSDNVVVIKLDTQSEDISPIRKENYIAKIHKINNCMSETIQHITRFYRIYFLLYVFYYILISSFLLFLTIERKAHSQLFYFIGWNTLLVIGPVALCVSIRCEFHTLQSLLNKFYTSNKFKRFGTRLINVKKWSIQCIHRDQIFDCGYFAVDLDAYGTILQFLFMLLFAMLPSTTYCFP